jgi:glucose/arabinose dehydrogenase
MICRKYLILTSILVLFAIGATSVEAATKRRASKNPDLSHFCDLGSDVPGLTVPPELCVRKFANVPTPRTILFAPNGDLFVVSPRRITPGQAPAGLGGIILLRQTDTYHDPQKFIFAQSDSLESIHGLLIRNGLLYYTLAESAHSVPYVDGDTSISTVPPTKVADMPNTDFTGRWTHSLAGAPDGSLLISRGQYDNRTCPTPDTRSGSVLRVGGNRPMNGDISIKGLRNPMYIRCMPWDVCYAAELTGDDWGGYGGKEKLVVVADGDNFGYPCCIDKDAPNPDVTPASDCSKVGVSHQTFPLHDTPFGFDWERDFGWPEPYRHGFFVGLHGAFGSWINAGLNWARTDPVTHMPVEQTHPLIEGFGRLGVIPRVADVRFAPDGRLFFSDDQSGAIYWVAPRTLKRPGGR